MVVAKMANKRMVANGSFIFIAEGLTNVTM
jgi:hypothetical protein